MSRLPNPGGDIGSWGTILNDFLRVSHNADGSLKDTGIVANKYIKPNSGIPKTDLDSSVQTSLANADAAAPTPDANSSTKGKIQLSGDLGGTAAAPTVPGLASKANDAAVVHTTGNESVAGNKTLSGTTVISQDGTSGATFNTGGSGQNWQFQVPANDAKDGLSIKGASTASITNLFMVRDYINAPIAWISNAGGLGVTDNIKQIDNTLTRTLGFIFQGTDYAKPVLAFGSSDTNMTIRRDATLGLIFTTNGTDTWRIGNSGNLVPAADASYALGANTARITQGYFSGTVGVGKTTFGTVERLGLNTPTTLDNAATAQIATGADARKGLAIQQNSATQSSNLLEFQKSSDGSALASFNATGAYNAGSQKITGVANGTASTDAVNLGQLRLEQFAAPAAVGSYSSVGGNTTTGTVSLNVEYAIPIMFSAVPGAASKLSVNINSTVATSILRCGVRNDAGLSYPYPGSLINECSSTFSGSAGIGNVDAAITWTPVVGTLYWLVCVTQTAAANVIKTNAVPYSLLSNAALTTSNIGAYTQSGVSGALGNTFSATIGPSPNAPRVSVLF